MAQKTLEQLMAERQALDVAFANLEAGPVAAIVASLKLPGAKKLRNDAEAARNAMPEGEAKTQMGNVVIVIDGVTRYFDDYLAALQGRLSVDAPPSDPA